MVDVYDSHIVFHVPGGNSLVLNDFQLEYLFDYPEEVIECCDNEAEAESLNMIIPDLLRVRNRKRDLYIDMGFSVLDD